MVQEVLSGLRLRQALSLFRSFLFFLALMLAVFPSVMKMYYNSHWFHNGGDYSVYKSARAWFGNRTIPFHDYFNDAKTLMRVYFFIVPYFVSGLLMTLALLIPSYKEPMGCMCSQRPKRVFGSILRRTWTFPPCLARWKILPERISVGEFLGVVAFLAVNIAIIAVRVNRSLLLGSRRVQFLKDIDSNASRQPINTFSWPATEVWAKTLGVVSIANIGWYLLMPIGRKSILLEALGLSWERAVKYHRWVGYYSVLIMFLHGILYVMVWTYGDGNLNYDPDGQMLEMNMVPWYCGSHECSDKQARMLRRNTYGFVALGLVLIMTVTALPSIRRKRFELFYYIHHLFILVLVFVCLHYKASIIYLIPGIAIYAVDKLMALYSYRKTAPVTTRMLSSDVLEVSFKIKPGSGVQYKAGDYIFLNVPLVSHLQWHPFSITSSPAVHGNRVFFHIKAIAATTTTKSWTSSVIEEANKRDDGLLHVRLDGFYGNGMCDQIIQGHSDGVILVGGGIGVDPMMSLAIELCETTSTPITLIWIVRTIEEFSIFAQELVNAQNLYKGHFQAKVWITMSTHDETINKELNGITKATLFDMDSIDQLDLVKQQLETVKSSVQPMDTDSVVYELDQPSLSGCVNALVMTMSILLATVGYALSAKIAKRGTPQDKITIMDLLLVFVFVLAWIVVVIVIRLFMNVRHKLFWPEEDKDEPSSMPQEFVKVKAVNTQDNSTFTSHTYDSISLDCDIDNGVEVWCNVNESVITADSSSETSNTTDEEGCGRNESVLESMIENNIGNRPNISEVFTTIAKEFETGAGNEPVHISVLACGPKDLVKSINNYANSPSIEEHKKKCAVFQFIEEDWEW